MSRKALVAIFVVLGSIIICTLITTFVCTYQGVCYVGMNWIPHRIIHYIRSRILHPNEHFPPKFYPGKLGVICYIPLIHFFFAPIFTRKMLYHCGASLSELGEMQTLTLAFGQQWFQANFPLHCSLLCSMSPFSLSSSF